MTSKEADSRKDYRISGSKVTLSDGQRTAPVPISIVNDHDPELNETFTVRLLSNDESAVIGLPSQCDVTIEENDYPYGLIGTVILCCNSPLFKLSCWPGLFYLEVQ